MTDRTWWLLLAAASLSFSACMKHEPLTCSDREACPEGLVCGDGACIEGQSCDNGGCASPISICPSKPPSDPSTVLAAKDLHCSYGEECCCGACYPSMICLADAGDSLACLHTDACLVQSCDSMSSQP